VLEKRGVNIHSGDFGGDGILNIMQSKKVCVGEQFAKYLQAFFPSPHPREPIMNNGHFHEENPWSISFLFCFLCLRKEKNPFCFKVRRFAQINGEKHF
jgi:hypothetical protein